MALCVICNVIFLYTNPVSDEKFFLGHKKVDGYRTSDSSLQLDHCQQAMFRSYVRVLKVDLFYGVLEVSEPKVLPRGGRSVDVLFDSADRQSQIPTSLKVHFTNGTSTFQGTIKPGQHTTLVSGSKPTKHLR